MIDRESSDEALNALINPIAAVLEDALDTIAQTPATPNGYADTAVALAIAAADLAAMAAAMEVLARRAETGK